MDVSEENLRKSLDKIASDHQYENYDVTVTPINSDGANFTSKLFLASITAPDKPKLDLFAKVAAVGETFRSQMMADIFTVEHYAYNTLAKIYNRIEDKYEIPLEDKLVMPKFYLYDNTYLKEILVLQNLSADGFTCHSRFESMNWKYASRTLEELAKMHALSIVFLEEYPEEFEEACRVVKMKGFDESADMVKMMDQMIEKAAATLSEDLRIRLQAFLDKREPDYAKNFLGSDKRPVLAHGDFRASNVMYKEQGDGLNVMIVDYQCINLGVGIRDVLYFLLTGTDEEFRGKYFHQLLDHYYEQICVNLRRFKKDPAVLFPREHYDYEVKKNLPFGMMIAMIVLPVVTASAENTPTVNEEMDVGNLVTVQTNSLFESRVNGLVRDCVKWGAI